MKTLKLGQLVRCPVHGIGMLISANPYLVLYAEGILISYAYEDIASDQKDRKLQFLNADQILRDISPERTRPEIAPDAPEADQSEHHLAPFSAIDAYGISFKVALQSPVLLTIFLVIQNAAMDGHFSVVVPTEMLTEDVMEVLCMLGYSRKFMPTSDGSEQFGGVPKGVGASSIYWDNSEVRLEYANRSEYKNKLKADV